MCFRQFAKKRNISRGFGALGAATYTQARTRALNSGMETSYLPNGRRISKIPLRAILVEDSRTIRDTLVPTLKELANTEVVAWATTSAQAKHALSQWEGQWQLVIVDLFLAAGSGLDVLKEVSGRKPGQLAFVLSNYATAEMRRRCMEFGADEVFDKSTEIDSFIERCIAIERAG